MSRGGPALDAPPVRLRKLRTTANSASKTESGVLGAAHRAAGLHRAGVMAPEEIKALREPEQVSQPVIAS